MLDSIRFRLTLWHIAALAVLLAGFCAGLYAVLYRSRYNRVDTLAASIMDTTVSMLAKELSEPGPSADAPHDALKALSFPAAALAIYDSTGRLLAQKPDGAARLVGLSGGVTLPEGAIRFSTRPTDEGGQSEERRTGARRITFPQAGKAYVIAVGLPLNEVKEELAEVRRIFFIDVPVALLFTGLTGCFLTHKTLQPVVAMSEKARRIGAASLQERLQALNPRDELGWMASAFNELLDCLAAALAQQRQFMADASHELRTPVSVIRTATEVTLTRQRSEGEYRSVLRTIDEQGRQLSRLVEDMLRLARADSGSLNLQFRTFHLDELLSEIVCDVRVLGASKGVHVEIADLPEAALEGDEDLLRQMILNLLDNAVKYTPPNGHVRLDLQPDATEYSIIVSDTGPGIPKIAQSRIFERFYRVDPSHSWDKRTSTGGAGLGLSIARWIAEAHYGRLELRRSDETGSVFVAILPMATPAVAGPPL